MQILTDQSQEIHNSAILDFNEVRSIDERQQVVAFRTHLWDNDIALSARNLAGAAKDLTFCVIADETRGILSVPGIYQKISHNNDFADLDLPSYPGLQTLWYNADYPLYRLRKSFPDAEYYIMVEFDVVVNIDISLLIRRIFDDGIDMLVADFSEATTDWGWADTLVHFFKDKYQCLLPFLVVSARAVDYLLNLRKEHALKVGDIVRNEDWPYCEGFVASAIKNDSSFKIGSLGDYVNLLHFTHWPPISAISPLNFINNTINHPVLMKRAFINKILTEKILGSALDNGGILSDELYRYDRIDLIPAIFWRYRAMGRVGKLEKLRDMAAALDIYLPEIGINIARGKIATQSSVCEWSAGHTVELDAQRLVNERENGIGNHTSFERDPWWQCDLAHPTALSKIIIFNRIENRERCVRLCILASNDAISWSLVIAKLDSISFGGADGDPFISIPPMPITCRYLRIQLIGEGILNLDQIELY
jgi:hypothetical protein